MKRKTRRPEKRGQAGRAHRAARHRRSGSRTADTDILILSDGTVMAHNLTPAMATVLHKLNPEDETIRARAGRNRTPPGKRPI
jgi:hypothetical protein